MARRHTPYYHRFVELGAEMGDRIGFDAALSFSTAEQEHIATRERVGMYDVYYQGPIDIKGPDAEALLQRVLVRDVERRLGDNTVLYSSLCNADGGMIDDLTCYRLADEHYWLIATPARAVVVEAWVREHARGLRAYVTNTISGTAYLSIQGPRSRETLAAITDADLSTAVLPYFGSVEAVVAEVPMVVSRTGYSGELGYELYYPRDYAEHIWDSVAAAGAQLGIAPCGLGALRTVRMEKRYPLYGLDVNEGTSPLEAGLGWAVDLDGADFIGRDALLREREAGPNRTLVGIDLGDLAFIASPADTVRLDGREIGSVTSGERGHFLGKSLAMAYVSPQVTAGTEVTIVPASSGSGTAGVVVGRPFYDPDGARVRA